MNKDLEFCTIRQFCKKYPRMFKEHAMREMKKQGYIPGIHIGNRFLINENAFLQKLNDDCERG